MGLATMLLANVIISKPVASKDISHTMINETIYQLYVNLNLGMFKAKGHFCFCLFIFFFVLDTGQTNQSTLVAVNVFRAWIGHGNKCWHIIHHCFYFYSIFYEINSDWLVSRLFFFYFAGVYCAFDSYKLIHMSSFFFFTQLKTRLNAKNIETINLPIDE